MRKADGPNELSPIWVRSMTPLRPGANSIMSFPAPAIEPSTEVCVSDATMASRKDTRPFPARTWSARVVTVMIAGFIVRAPW